ncbi:MAG: N-6 DNA methylase [Phycisphaerales bacterium]|nr:N-6 DNA methylase [Phycisphaerales bacterium]
MLKGIEAALRTFADDVAAKWKASAPGAPEAQLSGPVAALLQQFGTLTSRKIVAKSESPTPGRPGIPDFGVVVDGALCGYVELKAPGFGADTSRFTGRDKEQWERFKAQPNILYTDGNEWCLYRGGAAVLPLHRLSGDITKKGGRGISAADAQKVHAILTQLVGWSPVVPSDSRSQAGLLAPLCRLLREDVTDALADPASALQKTAADWRQWLFPDASDAQFADSYAQTVTFALLLARSEGASLDTVAAAVGQLQNDHALLSRALQVLTDRVVEAEVRASLSLLRRVIGAFTPGAMKHDPAKGPDPWLYFYEHFLAAYDPKLRRDSGVYYTPVQVVRAQVALVDHLLRERLGRAEGFAHPGVVTLDPAVGTGTYLLGVVDHALRGVESAQGAGAVPARASALARNLHGFEIMTGPYAVSELRLSGALRDRGASVPPGGLGVYLADALESPHVTPPVLPGYLQPIAQSHARALEVKDRKAVIVCLGNPPYDRHDAVEYAGGSVAAGDRARTGGWVRWGDLNDPSAPILSAFIEPAKRAGHGGDLKNLYNLYVYFWRWALWKVFEHPPEVAPGKRGRKGDNAGVVTFISAASYIRGDAFVGMREALRRLCHEAWVIDLGGEGRGTRRDENVFNIQTPVAICIALREGKKDRDTPAKVHYTSIRGTREEKYAALDTIMSLADLSWKDCPTEWHAPLRPAGQGAYFAWPLLTDLMPWQTGGAQLKRKWPISADVDTLARRWRRLLLSKERAELFEETRDRKISKSYSRLPQVAEWPESASAIGAMTRAAPLPPVRPYAYRSFDRQFVFADNRVGDYMRLPLWGADSDRQVYITSLLSQPLGPGPAAVASALIPDLDMFRGSFGAKATFPLYRDAGATEVNVLPGLLEKWGRRLKREVTPEGFAAYVYALLGHPGFVARFWDELEDCELRVPMTTKAALYDRAVGLGSRLLFLHTYGERCAPRKGAAIPPGSAKVRKAISDQPADYPAAFAYEEASGTLTVGTGTITGVSPDVWEYEVSGLRVVRSWLGYRMKERKGKKSSPLDDIHPERWTSEFTDELLRLLWILEHSLAMGPELSGLLEDVCAGPVLAAGDLPVVPAAMRKAPRAQTGGGLFEEQEGEGDEEAG